MSAYRTIVDWIEARREIGVDLVRMYLGVGLFVRGLLFIAESRGVEAIVDLSTFSLASAALAHYVTFAHLVGGLLLVVGLLTRLAALVQIPVLAGAVFLVHLQEGLLSANQSLEFSALVLFLLVVVFVFGPGPWSADRYVFEEGGDEEPEKWWRDEAFDERPVPEPDPVPAGPAPATNTADAAPRTSAPETTAAKGAVDPEEGRTCTCGNDLSHPRVTAEPRYGWNAGFFFMLGISAPVKEVVFVCEKCGTVLKRTRDSEVLRKYRWHTS